MNIITVLFLSVALAMDATCVSMANGLNEKNIKVSKIAFISLLFGLFQGFMPLIGYFVGHALIEYIEPFIPWIALVLLGYLGGKMIYDGIKNDEESVFKNLTLKVILIQAVATSIDALSVGLTIANYKVTEALLASLIIALVTFVFCICGHFIGKKFGDKLGDKAMILGGIILIIIGLEIFISSWF